MATGRNKLTAIEVKKAAPGKIEDGGGLRLDKVAAGGKWLYRYSIAGRRREMGLGSYPQISLASAREERDKWATVLRSGLDPITERQRRIEAERLALDDGGPTLEQLMVTTLESLRPSLKGGGHDGRWLSPVRIHVFPKLGKRKARSIHQTDLRDVIAPIWRTKHVTARKAMNRLRIAFRKGKLAELGTDPFTVDAAIHLLGEVNHKEVPIPSTPWEEIPALYAKLGENPTLAHRCLQLIVLTVVRSDAARGARLEEFSGDVWTVPPERVKGQEGKVEVFRVPLSHAAQALAKLCAEDALGGQVFAARKQKGGYGAISPDSLEKALDELGEAGRPHGLRTSFRTWVQDHQAATYDVAETALGHVFDSKVERAYARSDLLEQRRVLMERWADFVTGRA